MLRPMLSVGAIPVRSSKARTAAEFARVLLSTVGHQRARQKSTITKLPGLARPL